MMPRDRCSESVALLPCVAISSPSARNPPPLAVADPGLPECAALRYLPLVDGNQWAYDAKDDETGEQGMFVTRARRLPGAQFSLVSTQGSHALEIRPDGIVHSETSAYVLKAPLRSGAEWPGEGGSVVRIAQVDRAVDVPAGQFVGCLETIEETPAVSGPSPIRRVTTIYCPGVGITVLHAEVWRAGRHMGENAALRSFGKPVQFEPSRRP